MIDDMDPGPDEPTLDDEPAAPETEPNLPGQAGSPAADDPSPDDAPVAETADPPAPPPSAPTPVPSRPADLEPMSAVDERNYAMIAHLSCILISLIGPLVILVLNKQRSDFVDLHAKEAINFQINLIGWGLLFGMLSIVGIGICGLLLLAPVALIVPILAGVEANKGKEYRYPLILRLVT